MTLTDSDLFELLVALKAGEVTETVRTSLGCLMDFVADADVFLHNWRPG